MDQRRSRPRMIMGVVLALALLSVLVILLDWREVRRVVTEANWRLVPLALLFTAVSYTCLSYGFVVVSRIFDIRLGARDLFEIGYVSDVMNNVLTTGGVAGYSLRFLLMQRRGVATGDIAATSLFHSFFNILAMLALFPVGLTYLLLHHRLSSGASIGVGVAIVVLVVGLILAAAFIFSGRMRTAFLHRIRGVWQRLTRRDIEASLNDFGATMERGVAALGARPGRLAWLLGLIAADWTACIVALWFCFDALGDPVGPGVLVTGFAIGVTVGLLSMVPGGLGVQEGSMSGVYALLGVSFNQAVLVAILFRVVYYFVPFLGSLTLYQRLLREARQVQP